MTQDKHTALPWDIDRYGTVKKNGETVIAQGFALCGAPEAIANTAFIVRAVNNHYQLVEALEYARRFLKPEDVDMAYIDQALSNTKGGIDPAV